MPPGKRGPTRALRVCAGLGLLLVLCVLPSLALAGRNSMIPPGQEQRIRVFVDDALAAARAANELPLELDETVDIHIDRDRIRVVVHPRETAELQPLPMLVVFHPDAVPDDVEGALAPGVIVRCGPPGAQRECTRDEAEPWRGLAGRLAASRAPVAELVWQVEEEHGPPPPPDIEAERRQRRGVWVDRAVAIGAAILGLGLALFGLSLSSAPRPEPGALPRGLRRGPEAVRLPEFFALVVLLVGFVLAASSFTPMLPLHEHNSFIVRSDCAIDPLCSDPPGGAWNMTTMHVYGLLLGALPYHAHALAYVSLACATLALLLAWALARTLMRALGQPDLGPLAGLTTVAVLATHPVAWRLAGSATFWPWSIAWTFAAALAGVWAGLAVGDADRRVRLAGALAWVVAAACLAIVCGGNFVLLTMGACLVLAPLAWSPRGSLRGTIVRAVLIGLPALAVFVAAALPDYQLGFVRAFEQDGVDDSANLTHMWRSFRPLLLDARVSTRVWVLPLWAALAWLWPREREDGSRDWLGGARVLAPLAYAWIVPGSFLGIAAGEIIGSGYPVGFINHTWDLWLSALGVGLGLAWIVGWLDRVRPLPELLPLPTWLSWSRLSLGAAVIAAGLAGPRIDQGWQMATRTRVLERELLALEQAFAALPEHDLLVVPPRVLEPTTDSPSQWDPLEVRFPRGFYNYAMRARGLEPAPVVEFDHLEELKPGERALFYLGSSLRSFQPHEIASGGVPDDLERPIMKDIHDRFEFERVYEFRIATEQHPEISQRLGADRVDEIELGFFWLHPR